MHIKKNPYNIIITILAVLGIVLLLVLPHHHMQTQKIGTAPITTQQTDTALGLFTDTISNKNAAAGKTSVTTTQVTAPNACTLSLQISAGTATADGKSYTIKIGNLGRSTCSSASLSLYYGDGESYSVAAPTPTSSGYYWNFDALTGGASKTITLSTVVSSPDAAALEGCLSAANGSDACATAGTSSAPLAPAAKTAVTVPKAISDGKKIPIQSGQEAGIWEWDDVTSMSNADMENIAQQASANGFTAIYITIDHYLDLHYETDATKQESDVASYTTQLESFIRIAHTYGLAVDVEAGWRDWGEATQRQKAIDILSYVQQFNAAQSSKIRGVQYDIESYLLPQYDDDKTTILTNYVGLVDILEKQAGSAGIPLTMVLPHFYDATQQWTPSIAYNGTSTFTFNQVLNLLNRHAGNRIIIMAYRNTADGSDGAIALAQKEISDANNSATKIIIAQETGDVDPAYVTFANTSRSALFTQLATIGASFANDTSYGGIAIDYLDPFLRLK